MTSLVRLIFGGLILVLSFLVLSFDHVDGADDVPGPTSAERAYYELARTYLSKTGINVHYNASGASALIKSMQDTMLPFAVSDWPRHHSALAKEDRTQFPVMTTGIVPVVNLPGVAADSLVLDGTTLARIFLGQIKSWDDPAIRRLNPDVTLLPIPIAVIHRSDASGATFVFTSYLSAVNGDWNSKVNLNTQVDWPVGTGAPGDPGVALRVQKTEGSIGYVTAAQAKYSALSTVRMVNISGVLVSPTRRSFEAAVASADWGKVEDLDRVLVNQGGVGVWPIVGVSFALMPKRPKDSVTARKAIGFFTWVYSKGTRTLDNSEFAVISGRAVDLVKNRWATEIRDANGLPLYPFEKAPGKHVPQEKIPMQGCFPLMC